jgi:hypothetical protein
MTTSAELCRSLGALLTQYLDGQRSFEEVEASIAGAECASPNDRELLKRVYHVLNHFEIDEGLRKQDVAYAAVSSAKLRLIAASLVGASATQVQQSIDAFWRPFERSTSNP